METEGALDISARKADSPRRGFCRPLKGSKIRKPVGQDDVRLEAGSGQCFLNFENGTPAARATIDDLAMAARAQSFAEERHDRAMEVEGCLDKAEVIRREIANQVREPGLVLEFEKMKPGKDHRNSIGHLALTV